MSLSPSKRRRWPPNRRPVFLLGLLALAMGTATLLVSFAFRDQASPAASAGPGTSTTEAVSGAVPPEEASAQLPEGFGLCTDCHSDFDVFLRRTEIYTKRFSHEQHYEVDATCRDCHQKPTHTAEGIRRPTMAGCFSCHDQEAETAPPGDCAVCHPAEFPLVPVTHESQGWLPPRDRLDLIQAGHAATALDPGAECGICHTESFCSECHGVEMPHPASWGEGHPDAVRAQEAQDSCDTCHPDRRSCTICHHPTFDPLGDPWRLQHPRTVADQEVTPCFECHNSATCAHCHTTGEYREF